MFSILKYSILSLLLTLGLSYALLGQESYSSASLSMGKQYAQQGHIPEPDVVRVEEYLNYHSHDLPRPRGEESVALDLKWANTPAAGLLQIGITTEKLTANSYRPSLNISLVIDRSGSMSGYKMRRTKEALRAFARNLRPNDMISLVAFDHVVEVLFPSQKVGEGFELRQAISRLEARGSTNLNLGIIHGYQQVMHRFDQNATNRLIILTDAIANTGQVDPRHIVRNAQSYDQDKQVDYVLIGVGNDFNHHLSRELTQKEGLTLHFIHDSEDIQKVFVDEAQALLAPVAKQVMLEIQYAGDLDFQHLYGYEIEREKDLIRIPLNDFNHGLTQVILVEFDPETQGRVEVNLKYFDIDQQRTTLIKERMKTVFSPLDHKDMQKNLSIAWMAQGLKDMATLHHDDRHMEAVDRIEQTIERVNLAYPKGLDKDQQRVMDILAAYQRELVVITDRG